MLTSHGRSPLPYALVVTKQWMFGT